LAGPQFGVTLRVCAWIGWFVIAASVLDFGAKRHEEGPVWRLVCWLSARIPGRKGQSYPKKSQEPEKAEVKEDEVPNEGK
jgi:hypothetical protein